VVKALEKVIQEGCGIFTLEMDKRLEAALAAVTVRWWSSGSCAEETGQEVESQPCTLGQLTLASSGIC